MNGMSRTWGAIALATGINAGLVMGAGPGWAQALPSCAPPGEGEYLLLVVNESDDTQTQLRQTLPPNADISNCQYLDLSVTRVGGFTDAAAANAWAQYLTDIGGLEAFVARPPEASAAAPDQPPSPPAVDPSPSPEEDSTAIAPAAPSPSASISPLPPDTPAEQGNPSSNPSSPASDNPSDGSVSSASFPTPTVSAPAASAPAVSAPTPSPTVPSPAAILAPAALPSANPYQPQRLGDGYAILVNYYNNPALAPQLQQSLGNGVGLAAYQNNPYLLASYTSDPATATALLRQLTGAGFTAMIVTAPSVVVVAPSIVP